MKHWNIRQSETEKYQDLIDALDISPIVVQLLVNRGLHSIDQAKTFLRGNVAELYNPFLMQGMHEAVSRIKRAIRDGEKILIHGDYDVDGITAISILVFTLRNFGLEPYYYVPHRLTEGYGLSASGVKEAIRIGAGLVLTVDCGISSYEEVKALNAHNMDVLITDHHEVPEDLPPAYSIINPLQKGCFYPEKHLSGVGIVFKLCEALCSEFGSKYVWKHLDIVSLGTVSDVVPLVGENRILVKEGLSLLNNGSSNKGIRALIETSSLRDRKLGSFDIGFILGPRINAAGRLGSAETAVRLLLTDDTEEANSLAKRLNEANRERQRIENAILKEAMFKIDREINFKEHKVIILHNEGWHTGVIGIVASRIADRFYRPCILISTKDGVGRGSGRSIENFHLFNMLAMCKDVLDEYGGHKYACGLTILEENLERFKKTINELAEDVLSPDGLISYLDIDMDIKLSSLDERIVEEIQRLEPLGEGNPRPLFCSKNLRLIREARILKGEHIKFWVTDGVKNFEAIGFGLAKDTDIEAILRKSSEIDIAYSVSFNTWQGVNSIQLRIEDVQPSRIEE